MKLLLDTHVFLWWATEPEKLSPLTAQTKAEDMVLLSADGFFKHYDVAVMW